MSNLFGNHVVGFPTRWLKGDDHDTEANRITAENHVVLLACTITKTCPCNAPVICIPGSPGAGDIGDIAELKCLALTSDVSRQCRGFAGVMISRQYTVTLIQIRF